MKKYDNYCSNLDILEQANQQDLSNEFILGGIIDKFMIQFELGWKLLKDIMQYEGRQEAKTGSPREIIKTAYKLYGFMDEEIWLDMLADRNDLTHIYDSGEAKRLVGEILERYIPEFVRLRDEVSERYSDVLDVI